MFVIKYFPYNNMDYNMFVNTFLFVGFVDNNIMYFHILKIDTKSILNAKLIKLTLYYYCLLKIV